MKKTGLFTFVFIIAVSCLNEPDCYQLDNSTVVIYFKIIGGGNDLVQVTTAQSQDTDSIFFSETTAAKIILPLNPKTEETLYTLQAANNTNTLHFGYTRQVQFVSEACGERYYFQNLNVLNHDYDSVRVVNPIGTPDPEPAGANNLEIYRCPETNLMGISFPEATLVQNISTDFSATIILPPDGMLDDFLLPLDTSKSSTTYVFQFADASKTLKVKYSRAKETLAEVCGPLSFLYNLESDSVTNFTTVDVPKDSVQDLPVINLEVTP
jgi:hypothetical protein